MKEILQEATQRALIEGYKNLKENKPKKVEAKLADEIYTEDYDEKMESKQRDFKAEFLALPEKEQEKYKKCIPPLRRGLSNVEAETIAKERGLDAGILWWVTNIGQLTNFKESKKVEAEEDTTSAPDYLEKAFEVEVEYWLKALVDEDSNDELGKKAQEVLDDKAKMKSIVDELVNGSDDLWEDIHRRIEELVGLHYRESSRVNESNDVNNDINFEEIYKDVSEFSNEISIDDIKGAYNKLVDLKNQFNLSGKINVLGNFGFGIDVDKETAKRLYDEIDWYNKKYSVIIDETDFDKDIVCIAKECADAGQFGQIALDNVTNQAGYNDFARLEVTYNEI